MKNCSVYPVLGAVAAFIGAVIYTVLFSFEFITSVVFIRFAGVTLPVIVLSLITAVMFCCCEEKKRNFSAYYSKIVIWTAVLCLTVSGFLLQIPATAVALYTVAVLATVFLLLFLLLMWGLLLCSVFTGQNTENCREKVYSCCNETEYSCDSSYKY